MVNGHGESVTTPVIAASFSQAKIKYECSPGRFFAEMELKTILYYIVTKYDLKMKDGVRAPDDELGIGVLPSKSAKIMIRRRATFRAEELT